MENILEAIEAEVNVDIKRIKTLDAHSITWRRSVERLEVLDVSTLNGEVISVWVQCPKTVKDLYHWLGY